MRKLLTLGLVLFATSVHAENAFLGEIIVAGASLTNLTTVTPFVIPPGAKISVNCTAGVRMLSDQTVVTTAGAAPTRGQQVPASTNFPTSVGKAKARLNSQDTALLAVIGTGTCEVHQRIGTE